MATFSDFLGAALAHLPTITDSPEAPPATPASSLKRRLAVLQTRLSSVREFSSRHRLLLRALALTLVWQIVAQIVGYMAVSILPPSQDIAADLTNHPAFHAGHYPTSLLIWARWDGVWYLLLALQGYPTQVNILHAFFPAFPGLIHVVGGVLGSNYLLAGLLINRLLLFPVVVIFTQLVREEWGDQAAESAPLFFLLVPAAVFFLAIYTETLFLLACLACFLALRHQRWLLAGLCCALATATRLPGIVLVGAVLVEGIVARRFWKGLGAAALGTVGLPAYALYLAVTTHDPLAFQHAYNLGWGNDHLFTLNIFVGPTRYASWLVAGWPWHTAGDFTNLSYLLALVVDVVLLAAMWRPLRWSYRVFALGSILLPLFSSTIFAYNRYSVVLFPFVLVACRWTATRPTLRQAALLTMGAFSVLNIVLFTAGYWVG
ncbi:MAG TPA: mannosyltransferase family protein [Ktedonobacterales bacterium]